MRLLTLRQVSHICVWVMRWQEISLFHIMGWKIILLTIWSIQPISVQGAIIVSLCLKRTILMTIVSSDRIFRLNQSCIHLRSHPTRWVRHWTVYGVQTAIVAISRLISSIITLLSTMILIRTHTFLIQGLQRWTSMLMTIMLLYSTALVLRKTWQETSWYIQRAIHLRPMKL